MITTGIKLALRGVSAYNQHRLQGAAAMLVLHYGVKAAVAVKHKLNKETVDEPV